MVKKQRGRPKKVKPVTIEIQADPIGGDEYLEKVAEKISDSVNSYLPEIIDAPTPEPIQTKIPAMQDRMMRYAYRKPRSCPQCSANPVVTRIKRKGYALYRCRVCEHQWEITV